MINDEKGEIPGMAEGNEFNSQVRLHMNEKEDILIDMEEFRIINLAERL